MILGRARSTRIARAAAAFALAMVFAHCAATQKSVGGWFGAETPTPSPTPKRRAAAAAQAPRVYYARVEGLTVYADPSASSKVVGTLSLHERVARFRVERGFAFVESTKSGVKGWVDNAQLTWRLPAAPTTAAPSPEEAEPEEAPPEEAASPAVEETQAPGAPEATATAAAPLPTPTTPAPTGLQTPRAVGPSIFNPY